MLRAEKTAIVEELQGIFSGAGVVVVTRFGGMNVAELQNLRGEMRKAGASFRVIKNRLAKRAIEGSEYEVIGSLMEGPTAIGYSADPVSAPKALTAFRKKNDKLEIVGGGLQSTLLDADAVKALADMPPIEEVRSKLLGVLVAPSTKIAALLNAPARDLVGIIGAPGTQLAQVLRAKSAQG